ncbi:hypothetical protein GUITHDRAFT_117100 [Guillardia theta CCMP2712]|uniref:Uncharacterized protein n=1 Tax=Guillardia theta (strain CCMP2712) TaxID=905079 RepID=L1ILK1_GUITC|nr:hypothetical protein GUITHDRAFT_117100 [Guillardia theta CCMP2712]EKX36675.1 hypothetical protein GUITHDRAFT_117100 [Guillardia theta CCMP2712]|eukprot:XP_005823655.1 hypothetical protein GUITHDRAFT_117100 [Guillardia theta CCMP2712]
MFRKNVSNSLVGANADKPMPTCLASTDLPTQHLSSAAVSAPAHQIPLTYDVFPAASNGRDVALHPGTLPKSSNEPNRLSKSNLPSNNPAPHKRDWGLKMV